jgi:hemerythrin superfamily protein
MSDVFHVLKADHELVRTLLDRLQAGRGPTGAGPDRPRARKKLVERVIIEQSKHEAAEEELFWPLVRERVAGGESLADDGIGQEQETKTVLKDLDGLEPDDGRFEELLDILVRDARAHMTFEETRVWPRLRRALTGDQAARLGMELVKGKALAPTHPHPGITPEPGILKASGVMTAAADRLRDAATGRGRD